MPRRSRPIALKSVVILQDPAGLSMRVRAMQDAHPNVVPVAPRGSGSPHCIPFDPVEEWLCAPEVHPRRLWWKCDAVALSAVHTLGIDADFYWFIESDVAATQERWKAFFRDFEDDPSDVLCLEKMRRSNRHECWRFSPPECHTAFLMAVYRLSRRMVEASNEMAPRLRNVFCEMAVPLVADDLGVPIHEFGGGHYKRSTISTRPSRIRVDPGFINHPVKSNTYGP